MKVCKPANEYGIGKLQRSILCENQQKHEITVVIEIRSRGRGNKQPDVRLRSLICQLICLRWPRNYRGFVFTFPMTRI